MKKLWKAKDKVAKVYPVWQKLNVLVNAKAKQLAGYLNGKAAKLGRRNIAISLFILCIGWGAMSIGVATQALRQKGIKVSVTNIIAPKPVNREPMPQLDSATTQALNRIRVFKHFLDSLRVSDISKYNTLVQARPGLVDSIGYVEKYYGTTGK